VSIDTQSASVARACLDAGATIINDISALRHDPAMLKLLAKSTCDIVLMHMQGTPKTMQRKPAYRDVVAEVLAFLKARIRACEKAGIKRARLIVDPGIGFGKTFEHNLTLLQNIEAFGTLNVRLLLGVSRKKFLGVLTGEDTPANRADASATAGVLLAQRGVDILRVHDVAEHAQALRICEGLNAIRE
jgi:dihydropteroate synthase